MCVGTEQTRQRSKMKGRHGQGEREKEGVRHMTTLDRVWFLHWRGAATQNWEKMQKLRMTIEKSVLIQGQGV